MDGEGEIGIQIAYASALGQLGVAQAAEGIIALAERAPNRLWAAELNLALARLAGVERQYVQLWRKMRTEPATNAERALQKFQRQIADLGPAPAESFRQCLDALGREDLSAGCAALACAINDCGLTNADSAAILDHCRQTLTRPGPAQAECLPLAIACLHAALMKY